MRYILNTLFPAKCFLCNQIFFYTDQNVVCQECIESIRQKNIPYCRSCGKKNQNCQDCLKKRVFKDIRVFTEANKEVRKLISAFKFKNIKNLSKVFADIIKDDLNYYCETEKIDIVTYVPIHSKVLKSRGYNHLYLILKEIFPNFYIKELVKKVKNTYFQSELTAKERENNLEGAFSLTGSVKDKRILIFDDILTTGSTLRQIHREIKKGDPEYIYGYVIAR